MEEPLDVGFNQTNKSNKTNKHNPYSHLSDDELKKKFVLLRLFYREIVNKTPPVQPDEIDETDTTQCAPKKIIIPFSAEYYELHMNWVNQELSHRHEHLTSETPKSIKKKPSYNWVNIMKIIKIIFILLVIYYMIYSST